MKWRKLFRIVHRDLGYVCIGLTIIYSVSGIAVNHVDDWNPNYNIEKTTVNITAKEDSVLSAEVMIAHVLGELNITEKETNSFRSSPTSIDIFFNKKTIVADLTKGICTIETVSDKPVLRESNFLHLNNPKRLWTYVADLFAVSLILLAITGMFMLKGKKGITGRGKYFTALGFLIPLLFLLLYF